MRSSVIRDLAADDAIVSAALLSQDGFVIENHGPVFDFSSLVEILEINNGNKLITIVGEKNTVIAGRIDCGDVVCIICESGGNLGKMRLMIDEAINSITELS
ncbi:MAG: hypothetical protein QGI21_01345 [Candidatus Poseidoniaceae archaeon]|nr:hypothetical protein [Candidatus Poseidoniaceae archaeon]